MQSNETVDSAEIIARVISDRIDAFTSMSYVDHLFDSRPATLPYHIIGMRPGSGKATIARDIMLNRPLSARVYSPIILREGVILYGAASLSAQNIIIVDSRTIHKWRYLLAGEMCCFISTRQQLNSLLISRDNSVCSYSECLYSDYKYLVIMAPVLVMFQKHLSVSVVEYDKFINTLFAYCVIDIDRYINFPLVLAQVYFVLVDTIRYINNTAHKINSRSTNGYIDKTFTFNNCILPNLNSNTVSEVSAYKYNIYSANLVRSTNNLYINIYNNTVKYSSIWHIKSNIDNDGSGGGDNSGSGDNRDNDKVSKMQHMYHRIRYSATLYNIKSMSTYGRRLSINLRVYNNVDISLLNALHIAIIKNYILMGRIAGYNKYNTLAGITDIHYCGICSISKPRGYFLVCCFNTVCADCFSELMSRLNHICPYCRYSIIDSAVSLNIYSLEHIATTSNINLLYVTLLKSKLLSAGDIKSTLARYVNVKLLDDSDTRDAISKLDRDINQKVIPAYHIFIPPPAAAATISPATTSPATTSPATDTSSTSTLSESDVAADSAYLDTQLIQEELLVYLQLNSVLISSRSIVAAINGGDMYNPGTVLVVHSRINEAKFLLKYVGVNWADFSKIYKGGDTHLGKFRAFLSGKIPLLVINMEEIISEYTDVTKIDIYDTFCKHGSTTEFYSLLHALSAATTRVINYNLVYVSVETRWRYYDQLMRMLIKSSSRDHNSRDKSSDSIEVVNVSIM